MRLLFCVLVLCASLLRVEAGDISSGITNVLSSLVQSNETVWDGAANCAHPPPFIRTDDDIFTEQNMTDIGLPPSFINGTGFSMWPALGCLTNAAVYYDDPNNAYAMVTIIKGKPQYWLVTGKLEKPGASFIKNTRSALLAYGFTALNAIQQVLGEEASGYFTIGASCDKIHDNKATYRYMLSDKKAFRGFINQIEMNITMAGETSIQQEFMISAPANIANGTHLIAAVSMDKPGAADCDVRFKALYSDERYIDKLSDYAQKYFSVALDKAMMKKMLEQARVCKPSEGTTTKAS